MGLNSLRLRGAGDHPKYVQCTLSRRTKLTDNDTELSQRRCVLFSKTFANTITGLCHRHSLKSSCSPWGAPFAQRLLSPLLRPQIMLVTRRYFVGAVDKTSVNHHMKNEQQILGPRNPKITHLYRSHPMPRRRRAISQQTSTLEIIYHTLSPA